MHEKEQELMTENIDIITSLLNYTNTEYLILFSF